MISRSDFQKISPNIWEIPKTFWSDMKVPARIYVSEKMLEDILDEKSVEQIINVATLPGISKYAIAMPDIHQGYGFPIGGVAAMRIEDGVITPGGVGYDINCGVRMLASKYDYKDLEKNIVDLVNQMQRDVPSGVGRGGQVVVKGEDMDDVLNTGMVWAEKEGYALPEDWEFIEQNGSYSKADSGFISDKAKQRGVDQLGTLGAGNHFIEIQEVIDVYDKQVAKEFGMFLGQVAVTIHTGSRGLGHQVCTDYSKIAMQQNNEAGVALPDSALAYLFFRSQEGQDYFRAMAGAANYAWANRQIITFYIREAWQRVLGAGSENQLHIVYDVAHNMAKLETYGKEQFIVHRKGATRAFGPGHPELPEKYQATGQPVLIPGSMGSYSYVLAGTEGAMEETFGSSCHGAGRRMSRSKARKNIEQGELRDRLEKYGVEVRAGSGKSLVEEAPEAYKDIDEVVEVVSECGIAKKVAKLKPLAVVKG